MKIIFSIAALFLQLSSTCFAESIAFELYKVERDGSRALLEAGEKEYYPCETVVKRTNHQGFHGMSKEIELANGFSVSTVDTYKAPLMGFALRINKLPVGSKPHEFSWAWFSKGLDGQFEKLKGGAPVLVKTKLHSSTQEELLKVEFETDVEINYIEDRYYTDSRDYPSHIVVIKSGSVLAFPSVPPNEIWGQSPQ